MLNSMRIAIGLVVVALAAWGVSGQIYINTLTMYNPPSSIPNSGYVTAVVEWSSNASISTNIHLDLSDVTQSYLYDGGATVTVLSPGSGVVTLTIPLGNVSLNIGDVYTLHAYMAGTVQSTANGGAGNDWQISPVNTYTPVTVAPVPTKPQFSLYSTTPTMIPYSGMFALYAYWSSPFAGYTSLHMDLSDLTQNWQYDGGAYFNASSPGSGVVILTLNITTAAQLSVGDSYDLHLYLTAGVNSTLFGTGNDWQHEALDTFYPVTVGNALMFPTSLTITSSSLAAGAAPTLIPPSGNFTVTCSWSTNYPGVINLHLDLSDITQAYAYDGGTGSQVVGPGAGSVTFVFSYNGVGGVLLNTGDRYQLHAYMTPQNVSEIFGGSGNDWQHTIYDGYYPVTVGVATTIVYPNSITIFNTPAIVPPSGTIDLLVEYSSNIPGSTSFHIDLSDVSASWLYNNGASRVVPTPGAGFFEMSITISGTLNVGDIYNLHGYMTSYANTTLYGSGNDWQNAVFNSYDTVVVSTSQLLTNQIILLNPPTTIPNTVGFTLDFYYTSNLPNGTYLHCDLSDVTQNWLYDVGASPVLVPSPGSGYLQMAIPSPGTPLTLGDTYNLHTYMASLANATLYGTGNDWAYAAYNGYNTVTVATQISIANSLTPINPPTTVPTSGNFTVLMAWSSNVTGGLGTNLHLDLSDVSQNWAYEGGSYIQVESPGSGVLAMTVNLGSINLTVGDVFSLHAYLAPTATGLQYGPGNDWQYAIFNGYTTVQAVTTGTLTNTLTFINPPALVPNTGNITVTVSWTSTLVGGSNIHVDFSDVSQNWLFIQGSMVQVASPGTGTSTFVIALPAGTVLSAFDVYELHAYMASSINGTMYGTGNDWQHSARDSYWQVSPIPAGGLVNSMSIINPPQNLSNTGIETFQVLWQSNVNGLVNLHLDISDVTLSYFYGGGSFIQVTGPGSGTVLMAISFNENGTSQLKIGDAFVLHAYMASQLNSSLYGGTGNDWQHECFDAFWPVTVAPNTSFVTQMALVSPPSFIPSKGYMVLQAYWSSGIPVETDLHCDLSDVTMSYTYDGGASSVVTSPGAGFVVLNLSISPAANQVALNSGDVYTLHLYMASTANGTLYGTGNDWANAVFNKYYTVTVASSNSGGSSSSLSSGAIAGIVIGCVVGVGLFLALLVLFMCGGRRAAKGEKTERGHTRHEDEASVSREQSQQGVEMGEAQTRVADVTH